MSNHELTIGSEVVRKLYRRTDRDQPAREWAALSLVHEHAPDLGPRPLAREDSPPVVVMSRVPGVPLDTRLMPAQLDAMLAAYRTLFAIPLTPSTPQRWAPPSAFLDNNLAWLDVELGRADLPDVVRRALTAARAWHADPPRSLGEVRDPVMGQGDGRVDNMLWDGHRVRLIDFEGGGVGDLAFEVADLAEHVSARLPGVRDPEAAIAGFDLDPAQLERVAAYRIVLATFWLLMLLPGNPGHARNPAGSLEAQAVHLIARPTLDA